MIHSILVPEKTISVRLDSEFFETLLKDQRPTPKDLAVMVGDLLYHSSQHGKEVYQRLFKAELREIMEQDDTCGFFTNLFKEDQNNA